ncbi:nicotine blue oxidoreductase [Actinopolymorpha cephalotaxi]|uniref:Nicotine blue oxidoreductase n=1 Tax=Actinopolymorpha cephalotaxi TaxID=504797 RepID=A0A1I2NKN9_9ACTN|nr:nucleotidyltransferase family protein [Actinopolymorpha cephalotaxi]NYH85459.1 nicotine blue oxidoreductase [Actinopolymorpha cephalotaxi]SFG04565.1 nicotine blue oxidoreductase [Actinopolymorpha cephalotaxi]
MTVAGLLLAAGAGKRLGRPKALVDLGERLLVERGLGTLTAGGCAPVHVVLGAAHDEVLATADLTGATVVHNRDWRTGLASSLRAGLASLPPEAEAVVVALVDQPLVTPEVVRRLRQVYDSSSADSVGSAEAVAAVATYDGKPRNPVLLARASWADVAAKASGDTGARAYLRAHQGIVTRVPCDGAGAPDDVDTPEELATLRRRLLAQSRP